MENQGKGGKLRFQPPGRKNEAIGGVPLAFDGAGNLPRSIHDRRLSVRPGSGADDLVPGG